MSPSHFRELDVWRLSIELAKAVYILTADFPKEERYGLTSQLQRAAVSVPSNIAEGNARASTRDYARFVSMARGSIAELQTQLTLAAELSLADAQAVDIVMDIAERVGKMLHKLHYSLNQRLETGSLVPGPRSRS
ncbi:four helix bundle protein [Xanthomonas sp. NCPPB 2654]|uniref:four helix bundle protein n=1 Tax=unclassified Xanthomonas TaxID=2643310 RepID=UPI0021E0869E|nr:MULTISPECIES: four helix bundle protein [unclassified Xanthomonas]MDL5367186.1 four helix bundle protein [Xanthomonas sp. NCPPB 2654]MDR6672988.1 four helix bundle protein [Xanthomonas translucens]UYC22605.1 four helix bundle protein [Xanthomonas sp. CFBP 8443]